MTDEDPSPVYVYQLEWRGRPDGENETHGIYSTLEKAQEAAAAAPFDESTIDEWIDRGNGWWQSDGTPYSLRWYIYAEELDKPAIFH